MEVGKHPCKSVLLLGMVVVKLLSLDFMFMYMCLRTNSSASVSQAMWHVYGLSGMCIIMSTFRIWNPGNSVQVTGMISLPNKFMKQA